MKSPLLALCLLTGCSSLLANLPTESPKNKQIQEIADKELKSARESLHPKGIYVVVAEPKTGKILAMSSWEKLAPKPFQGENGWAALRMFEPGSTFKPVAVVAALEKGKITPKSKIYCEKGLFNYGGKTIKDHFPCGDMTCEEILAKSSNIGAAKVGLLLSDDDFYSYIQRFGFGKKTGISIPWECGGYLNPPSKWNNLTKTRIAFGQCVAVTPIQLTMAYCALANGGNLMKPVMGNESPKVVRRVCSKKTADIVKNALMTVASPEGTAPLARVDGITVAGKTGTAQAISLKGRYLKDQYWTMFAGFFPVEHPKYVITVVVDEADIPPDKNYGGLVAAPIFSKIATRINALK